MNKRTDFDGLASNAAAMNAEDRFQNALALSKTTEPLTRAGRTVFESRIVHLPFHEKRAEREARDRVVSRLSRRPDADWDAEIAYINELEAERKAEQLARAGDNPSGPIDRHAAKCSHDENGWRIL